MTNKVIVVFKQGTPEEVINAAVKEVEEQGGQITQKYTSALLGFAATVPDVSVNALANHASVDYVEPDGEVSIYAQKLLAKQ
ncbi:hypothetical protein BGZ46_002385 [Entomortierella lignicola]|nr:hypothetical protein BGZ46_002385 [Entomortierella lignicola]